MKEEDKLKEFSKHSYPKTMTKVNDRIYHFMGYGHSNAIAVIGDTSVILIDTLDSDVYASHMHEELGKITNKKVETIIFTHGHPDHMGGSGAFRDTVKEVIKMAPQRAVLEHYDMLSNILNKRGIAQHGYGLSDEDAICQGIGIREGKETGHGSYDILKPTTILHDTYVQRDIDGVKFAFYSAVGEADDGMIIWLEDDKVLCSGDNYYACWPNTYAIRGTQYRDLSSWIHVLEKILTFPAEAVLPGHTKALFGRSEIVDVIGTYKDALQSILTQTLHCMDKGMTISETVEAVRLAEVYKSRDFLQEFYGVVEWTVKGIYCGYVGWFDTDPVHLLPLSDKEFAKELLDILPEQAILLDKIKCCINDEKFQLALQFLRIVTYDHQSDEIDELMKKALIGRASQMTSANARHYYLNCAHAL